MRKFKPFALLIILSVLAACTDGGPETWSSTISDRSPVTGQRIYLTVYGVTDNPPMNFSWNDNDTLYTSTFQDMSGNYLVKGTPTAVFSSCWTAPDLAGQYTITCTVSDKFGKEDVVTFDVNVYDCSYTQLLSPGITAYAISSDKLAVASGLYAFINNTTDAPSPYTVNYYSTTSRNLQTGWLLNNYLFSLFVRYPISNSYPLTTLWGGYSYPNNTGGTTIGVIQYNGASSISTTSTGIPGSSSTLNDVQVNGQYLWVSTNAGLYQFDTVANVWTPQSGVPKAYASDFSTGLAAVGTTNGVYYSTTGLAPWTRLSCPGGDLPGSWCQTQSVATLTNPLTIYALTSIENTTRLAQYTKNPDGMWQSIIEPDPDSGYGLVRNISRDGKGRIWCGKNRFNGIFWDTITGIDQGVPYPVLYSVVSAEGLVYFLTSSGLDGAQQNLYVRGKTP